MSNRWTRVPDGPAPALGGVASALVPLADLFMLAMVSRPATGSLRATWVTPATLLLSAGAMIGGLVMALLCARSLGGGGGWAFGIGFVASAALLAGSTAVALVGLAQRRA